MPKNLSYEECKHHFEEDPTIVKTALAVMGMMPQDEQPVEFDEMVEGVLEESKR